MHICIHFHICVGTTRDICCMYIRHVHIGIMRVCLCCQSQKLSNRWFGLVRHPVPQGVGHSSSNLEPNTFKPTGRGLNNYPDYGPISLLEPCKPMFQIHPKNDTGWSHASVAILAILQAYALLTLRIERKCWRHLTKKGPIKREKRT